MRLLRSLVCSLLTAVPPQLQLNSVMLRLSVIESADFKLLLRCIQQRLDKMAALDQPSFRVLASIVWSVGKLCVGMTSSKRQHDVIGLDDLESLMSSVMRTTLGKFHRHKDAGIPNGLLPMEVTRLLWGFAAFPKHHKVCCGNCCVLQLLIA